MQILETCAGDYVINTGAKREPLNYSYQRKVKVGSNYIIEVTPLLSKTKALFSIAGIFGRKPLMV